MSKHVVVATTLPVVVLLPSIALAQGQGQFGQTWTEFVVGVATLAAALFLLFTSLSLQRVAEGSAMAENIRWVVLSSVCLGAHVVFGWIGRFMPDSISAMEAQLGSDALIILALVFMCIYFYRVRSALVKFLKVTSSSDTLLAASQMDADAEPDLASSDVAPQTSDLAGEKDVGD
jgi:hypothetical protein